MAADGIDVVLIELGGLDTGIWDKASMEGAVISGQRAAEAALLG